MEEAKVVSMPRIGDPAPSFEAQTIFVRKLKRSYSFGVRITKRT
jgi:hypothetical protein